MTSTCSVRRPSDTTTVDGIETDAYTEVYAGKCRVVGPRGAQSGTRRKSVGGVEHQIATPEIHFPWDEDALRDGDICLIETGRASGNYYHLVEVAAADDDTALRVPVEAAQRPEGWV